MNPASPAPRKVPKWLVTPGVFVLLAASLLSMPSASAAYEDVPPSTQEVTAGYANGTFAANISASDDAYIVLESDVTPLTIYYNWTGLSMVGERWQIVAECRFVSGAAVSISVLDTTGGPDNYILRLFCPGYEEDYDFPVGVDAPATCWLVCIPEYGTWNLTVDELNGGSPSMRVSDFGNVTRESWIDQLVIRRVYTVAPPAPPPSPLLDWMLILILLILWVSFSAIGLAKPSGLLFMGGALCGIVLAFFFILPAAELPGIAVLGLAMTCMLGGVGIAISSGGEAG